MKNILVTGGSGFIGSHLCLKLLEEGNKVFCIDNLYCSDKENIISLINHENFIFIEHDVCCEISLDHEINQIFHLACPASPKNYQLDPLQTINTCFLGSKNMLEFALEKNSRILLASTSEIYGDPLVHPQKESYFGNVNTIGERSCYDEGKRIAETLFSDYSRQKGMEIRIARIFNTYGPNMAKDDGRVVSNFINQALSSQELTIYGDGNQTRSFCYISDLVEGLVLLMNSNYALPVNLGNPEELTIKQLANEVARHANLSVNISYQNLPEDDPKKRKPDISIAIKELGWTPKVSIDSGLERTLQYFKLKI